MSRVHKWAADPTATVEPVDSPMTDFRPPLEAAAYPFSHDIRVRFAETDAMGVVHHSRYLPYLEEARVEYLRSVGHPYADNRQAGLDAAVVECRLRYIAPLRFDDIVRVHLRLAGTTRATFAIEYLLAVAGRATTTAATLHAFVDTDGRPRRVPDWMKNLVTEPLR